MALIIFWESLVRLFPYFEVSPFPLFPGHFLIFRGRGGGYFPNKELFPSFVCVVRKLAFLSLKKIGARFTVILVGNLCSASCEILFLIIGIFGNGLINVKWSNHSQLQVLMDWLNFYIFRFLLWFIPLKFYYFTEYTYIKLFKHV